jgi:putative beta-1,4-xylosyltransferase IRX10
MLGNVRQMWQRFFYRDSMLLEAQRQKRLSSEEAPWSVEVSKLDADDDVFATFIQVN